MTNATSNFAFLAARSPLLAELGATAERVFPFDPTSCVLRLRLLAEAIAQDIAARLGIGPGNAPAQQPPPTQAELLGAVDARLGLDPQVRQLFHLLRVEGNRAVHEAGHRVDRRDGLQGLKVARELAVWFHRSFGGDPGFRPGPFVAPDDPAGRLLDLQQRIADLDARLHDAQTAQASQTERASLREAEAAQEREMSRRAQDEAGIYQQLAEDSPRCCKRSWPWPKRHRRPTSIMTISTDGATASSSAPPRSGPCPRPGSTPGGRASNASCRCARGHTGSKSSGWLPRCSRSSG